MPLCAECPSRRSFTSVKFLLVHLKKFHNFTVLSDYSCGERGCRRKFSSIKAFSRHLRKHDPSQIVEESSQSGSQTDHGNLVVNEDVNSDCNRFHEPNSLPANLNTLSLKDSIQEQADALVCKYYSNPSLPRNIVQNIVDDVSEFLCNGVAMISLREKVLDALKLPCSEQTVINDIIEMFELVQNPFSHVKTEYLRVQHFLTKGTYIKPEPFELGKKLVPIKTKTGVKYKWRPAKAIHIPVIPVLKKFLELPDCLQSLLDYMGILNSDTDCISNIIQGDLWKQKRQKYRETDLVLPLFLYYDDFESNDKLGPHSGKIGGIYVSIACLPPEIASRLENIFLAILFNTEDRDLFTVRKILEPLLKEFQEMEKIGIEVEVLGVKKRLYIVLVLVLGDNLGVHQLCGFVCGFAFANFPCRFCKVRQERMRIDIHPDRELLRNKENYALDVLLGDQAQTGVKEECALNSLESFHIVENFEADLLHDFDEGICHYVMTFVISKLTRAPSRNVPPVVKLAILNRRLVLFSFGTHSALYRTKLCITEEHLEKRKLKMNGSEMQCFVRNFGVLIGDLVPEGNEVWKLYLSLQKVLDLVVSRHLPKSSLHSLQYYLEELGRQYLSHGNTLKFKFHKALWHYCSIIEKSGPVVNLSVRRFESKHRQLKEGLYSNMSRVSAILSVAKKHQLGLSYRFLAKKSVLPDIDVGSGHILSQEVIKSLQNFISSLESICGNLEEIFMPLWINFKGSRYDNHSVVILDIDSEIGWPIFGIIDRIFVHEQNVAVMCYKFQTLGFSEHLHAFEVIKTKTKDIVNIESLVDPMPLNYVMNMKSLYIVLRYQV